MPPDLRRLGAIAFNSEDREALATWLSEAGWPKGSMGITTLDGYLTAFVVWPIELRPGAWLPPIWNGSGWRVPSKIDGGVAYQKFITLIVGYLQEIDRGLSAVSPIYRPTLCVDTRVVGHAVQPEVGWAMGFQRALTLGASGFVSRSPAVKDAARCIAHFLSVPHSTATPLLDPGAVLTEAVLVLATDRTSRGPLGTLPVRQRGH
jgi:yecA family protein